MLPTIVMLINRRVGSLGTASMVTGALTCAWFAAAAQSPDVRAWLIVGVVLCGLAALWSWRARDARLEIGIDEVIVHHPTLWRPLTIPRSAISGAAAGPAADIARVATIPRDLTPGRANVVLELAAPTTIRGFPLPRRRSIEDVVLVAVDPEQAAAAIAQLGIPAPTRATPEPPRATPPRMATILATVLAAAVGCGFAWFKTRLDPPPANAAAEYAEAARTEGRSRLPQLPSVDGAIAWRARSDDGSLLYGWQTGRRIRIRVDISPQNCSGAYWREWWGSADRGAIPIAANGYFREVHRSRNPVKAGGIDILTTRIDGTVSGDRLKLRFTRVDDYRSAVGDGVCHRFEMFSARRSG